MTQQEINKLTMALENGDKSYYVYALMLDCGDKPSVPFYIGKGRGARVLAHEIEADDAAEVLIGECGKLTQDELDAAKSRLSQKLQTIINAKGHVKRVIVKWGLTEDEAFMCESSMINLLKFCQGGTIQELTNIVNGHASEPEKESLAANKTQARTVEEFLNECAAPEKAIDGIEEKIAFIKINDFYPKCLDEQGRPDMSKVKDATRGIWKIDLNRKDKIAYLFALYRGRVVGIFHVTGASRRVSECIREANDYPVFPEETRRAEKACLAYPNYEAALTGLAGDQATRNCVAAFIEGVAARKRKLPEEVFAEIRKRIYFHVDDDVPQHIKEFMYTIVTKDGRCDSFSSQSPIQYNFGIMD